MRPAFDLEARQADRCAVVSTFVRARLKDVITLGSIVEAYRWTDCAWLQPYDKAGNKVRVGRDGAIQRQQLVQEWLYFLVNGFIMPLLQVRLACPEPAPS